MKGRCKPISPRACLQARPPLEKHNLHAEEAPTDRPHMHSTNGSMIEPLKPLLVIERLLRIEPRDSRIFGYMQLLGSEQRRRRTASSREEDTGYAPGRNPSPSTRLKSPCCLQKRASVLP